MTMSLAGAALVVSAAFLVVDAAPCALVVAAAPGTLVVDAAPCALVVDAAPALLEALAGAALSSGLAAWAKAEPAETANAAAIRMLMNFFIVFPLSNAVSRF